MVLQPTLRSHDHSICLGLHEQTQATSLRLNRHPKKCESLSKMLEQPASELLHCLKVNVYSANQVSGWCDHTLPSKQLFPMSF